MSCVVTQPKSPGRATSDRTKIQRPARYPRLKPPMTIRGRLRGSWQWIIGALPPEINSARMYSGPGSPPMLAAAAAWDGLAAELSSTASSYQSVIERLAGEGWLGPASASMAAAVDPVPDMDEPDRGAGRARRRSSIIGGGRVRGRVRRDGAPRRGRGQPGSACGVGRDQFPWSEHGCDRGNRGPLRRDVGAGRGGDVRLCRRARPRPRC